MLHFIYNPVSGGGKARQAREAIENKLRTLKVDASFHETSGRRHAIQLTSQITAMGSATVVAMGGDGTLNEVLNGIVDPAGAMLGLIPCGSGNDFAAAAGIPSDPIRAVDLILNGEAKYTDYMECSGVRGINAIGTGIDVDILRRYERMKLLRGSAAYLASLVLTLFTFKARRFSESTGGAQEPHRAFIACAGNGQSIGGGIPICPKASIDDGLLDVVIVDDIKKAGIPAALAKLMKRRVLELKSTQFRRQARLTLSSDAPMPIQIDGEIYEDLPFDVKLIHGKLRMFRP